MKHRNEKTINPTELQVQNTDHRSDDMIRLFQDQINQWIIWTFKRAFSKSQIPIYPRDFTLSLPYTMKTIDQMTFYLKTYTIYP